MTLVKGSSMFKYRQRLRYVTADRKCCAMPGYNVFISPRFYLSKSAILECIQILQLSLVNWPCYRFLPRCMQCRRALAMRKLSVCPSVSLPVCLFVKRVHCNKTEERSVQMFIPYERSFSLVFWLVGRPLLPEILGQPTPLERNRRFSTNICL